MVQGLVEHFTYAGILVILLLAGTGLPIPEEVPIVTSGVLSHAGVVRWWIALPLCIIGVLSGDCILYWSGRYWGEQVLERRWVRRLLTPEREATLKSAYLQHGAKIIFGARHVVGVRAPAFLTAGIAGIPFWKFLAADGAAALVGIPLNFGLAYFLADHIKQLMAEVHRIERWLTVLALAAGLAWLAVVRRRRGRVVNWSPPGGGSSRGRS